MKQHYLSAAWPAMPDADYQALVDSIEDYGVLNPITIFEGEVIDGWHRYRAATSLGMECPMVDMDLSIDPVAFVEAQNKNRRHLTGSQRAAAVVACAEWMPARRPNKGEVTSPLLKTTAQLAAEAKVSERTIEHVKAAHKAGLTGAVRDGALTAEQAGKIARGTPAKPKFESRMKPAQAMDVNGEDAGFDDGSDLEKYAAEVKETQRLSDLVESLTTTDTAAEIRKLKSIIDGLTGRLNASMAAQKAMERAQQHNGDFVHKLRKMLGVDSHQEILDAVAAMRAEA